MTASVSSSPAATLGAVGPWCEGEGRAGKRRRAPSAAAPPAAACAAAFGFMSCCRRKAFCSADREVSRSIAMMAFRIFEASSSAASIASIVTGLPTAAHSVRFERLASAWQAIGRTGLKVCGGRRGIDSRRRGNESLPTCACTLRSSRRLFNFRATFACWCTIECTRTCPRRARAWLTLRVSSRAELAGRPRGKTHPRGESTRPPRLSRCGRCGTGRRGP